LKAFQLIPTIFVKYSKVDCFAQVLTLFSCLFPCQTALFFGTLKRIESTDFHDLHRSTGKKGKRGPIRLSEETSFGEFGMKMTGSLNAADSLARNTELAPTQSASPGRTRIADAKATFERLNNSFKKNFTAIADEHFRMNTSV
jgi:hypothetical protein